MGFIPARCKYDISYTSRIITPANSIESNVADKTNFSTL